MGPVSVVAKNPNHGRDTPAKFANAGARLRQDDGHSKVKVSCGLVPTNALLRELFLDCRQLGNKRKTPNSSGLVNAVTIHADFRNRGHSGGVAGVRPRSNRKAPRPRK
jgi:hypothetical protein